MMRAATLAAGLILSATTASAASSDLARMVQTEYDFNDACARVGFKASFLQYLATDAVMFIPGPLNGHKRISERPDLPGKLQWYPAYAQISSAGDLGLSTGPWVYTNEGKEQGHGHFVTVWRKEPGGEWRAALDVGVDHPKLETSPAPLKVEALSAESGDTGAPGSIEQAEQEFARLTAEKGYRAAVEKVAHERLRVYRDGHPPAIGRTAAAKLLDVKAERAGAIKDDAATASGDFGYGYGVTGSAIYVHVWKHEAGGWKLLLDLLKPLDPPR